MVNSSEAALGASEGCERSGRRDRLFVFLPLILMQLRDLACIFLLQGHPVRLVTGQVRRRVIRLCMSPGLLCRVIDLSLQELHNILRLTALFQSYARVGLEPENLSA